MYPSKKNRRKCSIKVIYYPVEPQQQLAYMSGGGCYLITAEPILPVDVYCVCTVQTAIPQKNGEWGKTPMMRLINFITDKQYK